MRKIIGLLLVGLMLFCFSSLAYASEPLDELIGLEVWIETVDDYDRGQILDIRGDWLILLKGKTYVWFYILNIICIEIVDKDYKLIWRPE